MMIHLLPLHIPEIRLLGWDKSAYYHDMKPKSTSTRSPLRTFPLPFVGHADDSQLHVNQHYYGGEIWWSILGPKCCALSALMITTTDTLSRNSGLPRATSPVYVHYRYNNNDNIHLFETKVYWLCVWIRGKVAGRSDPRLGCRWSGFLPFFPPPRLSPALLSLWF